MAKAMRDAESTDLVMFHLLSMIAAKLFVCEVYVIKIEVCGDFFFQRDSLNSVQFVSKSVSNAASRNQTRLLF